MSGRQLKEHSKNFREFWHGFIFSLSASGLWVQARCMYSISRVVIPFTDNSGSKPSRSTRGYLLHLMWYVCIMCGALCLYSKPAESDHTSYSVFHQHVALSFCSLLLGSFKFGNTVLSIFSHNPQPWEPKVRDNSKQIWCEGAHQCWQELNGNCRSSSTHTGLLGLWPSKRLNINKNNHVACK